MIGGVVGKWTSPLSPFHRLSKLSCSLFYVPLTLLRGSLRLLGFRALGFPSGAFFLSNSNAFSRNGFSTPRVLIL